MSGVRGAILAVVSSAGLAASASAQPDTRSELTLVAGPSQYELTGRGTSFALNIGVTSSLYRDIVLIQPNLGYFTYTTSFGHRASWLFPEIGVQVQGHLGRVRPYVGAGLGGGGQSLGNPGKWEATLHAAGGMRMRLSGRWGLQAEVRYRSVRPWSGHTADFGVGVTHASF